MKIENLEKESQMQVSTKIQEMEDRNSDTKDGREKRIYLSKNILMYKIPGTKHPEY